MWHLVVHLLVKAFSAGNTAEEERAEQFVNAVNPDKFTTNLERMGYFRFADESKKSQVWEQMLYSLFNNWGLATWYYPDSETPADYRLYRFNGDMLKEKTGAVDFLKRVKPTFDRMAIPLLWSNESNLILGNELDHRISLNGKEYQVYNGPKDSLTRAGESKVNMVHMLNDQLKLSRSEEMLYLVGPVREGKVVFLPKKLQKYIAEIIKNNNIKPLESRPWSKWHGLR